MLFVWAAAAAAAAVAAAAVVLLLGLLTLTYIIREPHAGTIELASGFERDASGTRRRPRSITVSRYDEVMAADTNPLIQF